MCSSVIEERSSVRQNYTASLLGVLFKSLYVPVLYMLYIYSFVLYCICAQICVSSHITVIYY
eukprot:gene13434-9245_t